ncbi:MAG: ribosomal protein S18-alanine N-acetyltransferase [Eubacteriaceae bacterium]|nr:ribosomal protein S18-alanine N-acetyltransferase [Eubacteriaceae bacterium]
MLIMLRRSAASDISDMMLIEKRCFRSPWSMPALMYHILHHKAISLTAVIRAQTAGYVMAVDEGEDLHVTNLAVHPDFQRMGAAAFMMSQIILLSEKEGFCRIVLEVRESNAAALGLYRSLGFCVYSRSKNYYDDTGEDALLMERRNV